MNIDTYEFGPTGMCMGTDPVLLEEAKRRGFYNGNTKYNKMFSQIFFSGGRIKTKDSIKQETKERVMAYLRGFMQSFEPSHQEKEAICALLISEIIEEVTAQ